MRSRFRRHSVLLFLAVVIVRVGLSFGFALLLDGDPQEDFYDDIALNLVKGRGYVIQPDDDPNLFRPPGYPFFLAGVFVLTGGSRVAVYVLQMIFDIAIVLLLFRLADCLFGRTVAIVAAGIYCLYPFSAYYSVRILTETPFTMLLLSGLVLTVEGTTRHRSIFFVAAGALLGLATLFRFSIIFYVLSLIPAGLIAGFIWRRSCPWHYFVIVGACVVILVPWMIRNYAVTGQFPLLGTGSGYNLWLGNHLPTEGRDNDELEGEKLAALRSAICSITRGDRDVFSIVNDQRFRKEALRNIKMEPSATIALIGRKALRFWFEVYQPRYRNVSWVLVPVQSFLLIAAAIGVWITRHEWWTTWPLIYLVFYLNALHAAVVATFRYSLPIMPVIILFGAFGIVATTKRLGWSV